MNKAVTKIPTVAEQVLNSIEVKLSNSSDKQRK